MNPYFLCTWLVLFFHPCDIIYVITIISRATRLRACASSNNRTEISSSSFSHEGAANPYPRKHDGGPVVREWFRARISFCFLFFAIPPKFNRAIPIHNNTRTRGFQYAGVKEIFFYYDYCFSFIRGYDVPVRYNTIVYIHNIPVAISSPPWPLNNNNRIRVWPAIFIIII